LAFSISVFCYFLLWQRSPWNEPWEVGNFWIWSLQVLPATVFATYPAIRRSIHKRRKKTLMFHKNRK
jgi:hypothetical protein